MGAAVYLGIYKNGATAGGVEFSYTHQDAAADVYLDVSGVLQRMDLLITWSLHRL